MTTTHRLATLVEQCRACEGPAPTPFLSLGATPIANALVGLDAASEVDPRYPLEVGFCRRCALVQLTHELPAATIFGSDYPYFSSFSDSLMRHSAEHVKSLIAQQRLTPDSFVVELASNDGYLLRNLVQRGIPALGVEPTPGPAEAARRVGVPTLEAFFEADLGRRLRAERGPAEVVIANNVMAHVPDLNGFVEGMAALVADDGVVQVENPGVRYLLEHVEFDTVYHEHFCYFSTIAVQRLFARHQLFLQDVEVFPDLHGGTLRWTAGKRDIATAAVHRQIGEETALGLGEVGIYGDFGARVQAVQGELRRLLGRLRADGATIAAYGAAAKGATLLNSSGIGANVIDFVVDRNPHKQGRLMPGVHIPIVDPAALRERRPDFVLVLAWNVLDEVVAQQDEYLRSGGRFIVPVPYPVIL